MPDALAESIGSGNLAEKGISAFRMGTLGLV